MKKYTIAIIVIALVVIVALWAGTARKATAPTTGAPVVGAGAHCGGFIRNAPICADGYHCQLRISSPDTGGICVAD